MLGCVLFLGLSFREALIRVREDASPGTVQLFEARHPAYKWTKHLPTATELDNAKYSEQRTSPGVNATTDQDIALGAKAHEVAKIRDAARRIRKRGALFSTIVELVTFFMYLPFLITRNSWDITFGCLPIYLNSLPSLTSSGIHTTLCLGVACLIGAVSFAAMMAPFGKERVFPGLCVFLVTRLCFVP